MAKSVMTLMALLVRVISIWMTPARRANVPEISRPLAFMAGSQTCKWDHQMCQSPVSGCLVILLNVSLSRVVKKWIKTHCFRGAVGSCGHANATAKVKQVVQTSARRGSERCRHCSWRCTETSSHLWGLKRQCVASWKIHIHFVRQISSEQQKLTAGFPPRSPPSCSGDRNQNSGSYSGEGLKWKDEGGSRSSKYLPTVHDVFILSTKWDISEGVCSSMSRNPYLSALVWLRNYWHPTSVVQIQLPKCVSCCIG